MTNHQNRNITMFRRAVRLVDAAERAHDHAVRDLRRSERAESTADAAHEGEGWINRDYDVTAQSTTVARKSAAALAIAAALALTAARAVLAIARS